jgi:geranylgeranyl diphosphate synthase type I
MTIYAPQATGADGLPRVLGELRELTEPAIRETVSRLHLGLERVESYHRGWTTVDGQPSGRPTGKALRSALAVLSSRAVEGSDDYGIAAAVAVELVHDFSLLHDDLMDGDTRRRHRPTAWVAYGAGAAIISGDALLSLAIGRVLDSGSANTLEGIRFLNRCVSELIEGQALDLEFETRRDVTLDDCRRMAAGKTASLLECASALGAILAGAPEDQVELLRGFGQQLGMAFQLVDDAIGIWGDSDVTGKPVLGDLRSRKKTLPITAALESGADGLDALRTLMFGEGGEPSEELLEAAANELSEAGFHKWVLDEARNHLSAAERHVETLNAPQHVKADLLELAHFATFRQL